MDSKIAAFIGKHHVLTLATMADGNPYCANIFYAWMADQECFVFTSDTTTRHSREALADSRVAASIVLETRIVGRIQGLQITGHMEHLAAGSAEEESARRRYIKRFPYAAAVELTLWRLRPEFMKLTDNTLGFGKKIIWQRDGTTK